ncbi:hypothetical protein Tco_0170265 [Tanacetum coccineum]
MDFLAFIRTADPTKVRIGERQRGEDEPKLLDITVGRTVPLLPVDLAHAQSELDASVDKLFDEEGSGNEEEWNRIFTKRQKSKPNQTKLSTDLERARKTEAKGTKGLETKLKWKLPDRLDNVCVFYEVKMKSKSTLGYVIGLSIKNRARKPKP